jgi:hypothetical protein
MAGTEDDEAGNLPEPAARVKPKFVQCPLCAGADATFESGRPFRMHLLSPAHSLTGSELAHTVEAAELLATGR